MVQEVNGESLPAESLVQEPMSCQSVRPESYRGVGPSCRVKRVLSGQPSPAERKRGGQVFMSAMSPMGRQSVEMPSGIRWAVQAS